jgi:acyl carrier protein
MAAIADQVKDIVADELSVDTGIVTPQARFVEDLGADSLDVVELVMRFEEAFEIEIPTKTPRRSPPLVTRFPTSKRNRRLNSTGARRNGEILFRRASVCFILPFMQENPRRRVVVTGMGAVTPIGIGLDAFWQGIKTGANGIKPITLVDPSRHQVRFAGEITEFDPTQYIEKREAKRMDASFNSPRSLPMKRFCIRVSQLTRKHAIASA